MIIFLYFNVFCFQLCLGEASADTVVYFNINLILVNTDNTLAKGKIAAMSIKFMFGQIKSVL